MTKYLKDGVYQYGDNPLDVIGKYVKNNRVTHVLVSGNCAVIKGESDKWLCSIFKKENYNEGSLLPNEIRIDYYRVDNRVFLSLDLVTPALIGSLVRYDGGSKTYLVNKYEVGNDYVTITERLGSVITIPHADLPKWYLVDNR